MNASIFDLIRTHMLDFSATQKNIADYVMANPDAVTHMTIEQLASICNTSVATINRFYRRLGISSFQDFKLQLTANITSRSEKDRRMSKIYSDGVMASAHQLINNHMHIQERALSYLQESNISKAAQLMVSANRILFFGTPEMILTTELVCGKFMHSSDSVYCFPDIHMQEIGLKSLKEGDVLFVITDGHESGEYLNEIASSIQNVDAHIISVFPLEPLPSASYFSLASSTISYDMEDVFSAGETTLNFIIDVLLVEFVKKQNQNK